MSSSSLMGLPGMRLSPASHSEPHLLSLKPFPPPARAWLTRVCVPTHMCVVCAVSVHAGGGAPSHQGSLLHRLPWDVGQPHVLEACPRG